MSLQRLTLRNPPWYLACAAPPEI